MSAMRCGPSVAMARKVLMSVARSSVSRSVRRMRSRRSSPWTPKTARMITSSVTACMRGQRGNGSPRGQVSISWRATEAIRSP